MLNPVNDDFTDDAKGDESRTDDRARVRISRMPLRVYRPCEPLVELVLKSRCIALSLMMLLCNAGLSTDIWQACGD